MNLRKPVSPVFLTGSLNPADYAVPQSEDAVQVLRNENKRLNAIWRKRKEQNGRNHKLTES